MKAYSLDYREKTIETLIIIDGLTGIGKTTLQKKLVESFKLHRFVTTTTREKRLYEKDGIDYHFVPENNFISDRKKYLFQDKIFDCWYGMSYDEYKLASLSKTPVVLVAAITDIKKFQRLAEKIFVIKLKVREMDTFIQERKLISDRIHTRSNTIVTNEDYNNCSESFISIIVDGLDENEVFDKVVYRLKQQDIICDIDVN
jgi:guanylate kinase